jgi:fido (protein-threonine AMPylation protein)
MRDKYGVAQDSYSYNSSYVLKNKLNITDYEELSQAEFGFPVEWSDISKDEWINVNIAGFQPIHVF